MRRFWVFTLVLLGAMLLLFFVVQALHLPFLEESPDFWMAQEKWVAALAGIGLLVADVVAPVPSSIIMFVNGVLFGVFLGSLLSILGGLGATLTGHWIGTKGEAAGKRWMGEMALDRARTFFQKHGLIALIVSRPIPILAEAISIIAGISRNAPQTVDSGHHPRPDPCSRPLCHRRRLCRRSEQRPLCISRRNAAGNHCLGHWEADFAFEAQNLLRFQLIDLPIIPTSIV
ncbi:MAG: VTT domain-containing protein [Bacteroidetes bacterium]|nr:VTT domain-containing protein [Bacteroidota bacterium]